MTSLKFTTLANRIKSVREMLQHASAEDCMDDNELIVVHYMMSISRGKLIHVGILIVPILDKLSN